VGLPLVVQGERCGSAACGARWLTTAGVVCLMYTGVAAPLIAHVLDVLAFVASAGPQHLNDTAVGVDGGADQLEALRLGQAVHERDAIAERHWVHG
jgi:hypothetical protein